MEMLISPLSAENRVIRDFWGIKIARDIRVIFYAYFPQSLYRISLVRMKGLEPSRRGAPDPKSGVSANFTIEAYFYLAGLTGLEPATS